MKTIWALFALTTFAATAAAETCPIQIRLTNTAAAAPAIVFQAKATAATMFARLGINIQWTSTPHPTPCGHPIEIHFETGDPGPARPDSLAYAMPYLDGGTSIHVFIQRVAAMAPASRVGPLLGHVLAHEITHVLQGTARHSPEGVMKAHWSSADFRAMQSRPLPFASLDVLLLQAAAFTKPAPAATLAAAK